MFFSRNSRQATIPVPSGDRIQKQYIRSLDLKGKPILQEVGETDLQDRINSFRLECDINRIVKRAAEGDVDILHRTQGAFIDVSGIPNNVHDLHTLIQKSESVYNDLSEDLKQGRSFEDFLKNVSNFNQLVAFANQSIEKATAKEEVKADA